MRIHGPPWVLGVPVIGVLGVLVSLLMLRSRFKGVTRPKIRGLDKGWVAQSKAGDVRVWKSGFRTDELAAQWLAGQLGVPLASLRRAAVTQKKRARGPPKLLTRSSYSGVVVRQRLGKIYYQAQHNGQYMGLFDTALAAARVVSQGSGVPVSKLRRRQRAEPDCAKRTLREFFMVAHGVFKDYVPGDLECTASQETAKLSEHIFLKDRSF